MHAEYRTPAHPPQPETNNIGVRSAREIGSPGEMSPTRRSRTRPCLDTLCGEHATVRQTGEISAANLLRLWNVKKTTSD